MKDEIEEEDDDDEEEEDASFGESEANDDEDEEVNCVIGFKVEGLSIVEFSTTGSFSEPRSSFVGDRFSSILVDSNWSV